MINSQNEFVKEDTDISEEAEEDLPLLTPEEIEEEIKFQLALERNK